MVGMIRSTSAIRRRHLSRQGGETASRRDFDADKLFRAHHSELERRTRSGQWAYDPQADLVSLTAGVLEMLEPEILQAPIRAERILQVFGRREARRLRAALARALHRGEQVTIETRCRVGDSERRIVLSCSPASDARGTVIAVHGTCRDITETRRLEHDLRRTEQRLQLILDESIDVISHVDRQGRFVFVSPAAEQLTGFKPDEVVGRTVAELTHPDDFPMLADNSRAMSRDQRAQTFQYRTLAKSGGWVWIESTIRPLIDRRRKRVMGALSVSRDISERRRAEEELRSAHQHTEIANRAKSRFLANMSHELKTPLNAIIGFSEILAREIYGPIGTPRYKEYSELILESGHLLLDLINDLLDMAKIEAGRYVLSPDELDLEKLVPAAVRLMQQQFDAKRIAVEIRAPRSAAPIVADQRAVMQILLNLLSNAVKFTPVGGRVSIVVTEQEDELRITVSDTGIGIPEAALPRLARPFEQVHTDLHVAHEGTGLGLALVRSLARLHGGDILILSREGEGTSVTVKLPRSPAALHPAKTA
jgi:PAS domain S-box-containing protein